MKEKLDNIRTALDELNEDIELRQNNERSKETIGLLLDLLEELELDMVER